MRGEASTRRPVTLLAVVVCILVAALVPTAGAGPSSTLRQRAEQLADQTAGLAERSRSAVLTVYSLDARLERARARVAGLETQAASVRRQRAAVRRQLRLARRALAVAQRHLAARLRVVYEQGDADPLAVVLGSSSLDEALTRLDTLDSATVADARVIAQVRGTRTRLRRVGQSLARRDTRLRELVSAARAAAGALEHARAERAAYIRRLAAQRSLNRAQISSLESRASSIEANSRRLSAAAPAVTAPVAPPAVVGSGRTLTVVATAYALRGTTATGAPVGWGVVAVDPSVIPLGTRMTIPGYGDGVAADTGGGVRGAMIDLWFPTAAQAAGWGTRTVTITLH